MHYFTSLQSFKFAIQQHQTFCEQKDSSIEILSKLLKFLPEKLCLRKRRKNCSPNTRDREAALENAKCVKRDV